MRGGPLQGAVRLVTREQERQQQRTSVKSLALSESMSTGELDGLRSKVSRSTPQPKKKKTVASPPGAARSEADPPGDASKACSPGGDAEAVIEDAYARMVKKAARSNVRLERQVPQAPPREEQPSNKPTKKRRRRRRRRKRSVTKEVAPAARQQCKCTRAPNLLVGDSLVAREAGRFFSQPGLPIAPRLFQARGSKRSQRR